MLSGEFTQFPMSSIVVNRDERQRKTITDLDSMATSLETVGQINPIVIQRDGILRAGERRYSAAKQLGWTHIIVQFVEDMDKAALQLLELDENLRRVGLTWQEECEAVYKYHELKKALNPTWTREQTAEALNMSAQTVGQKINVYTEILNDSSIKDLTKFSTARGIVARSAERKSQSAVAAIMPEAIAKAAAEAPIFNEDFTVWVKEYDGNPFNFIHCDFPYGVNADKHDQGAASSFGGYSDGFDLFKELLNTLNTAMRQDIIAESAHLMFWFSMDYYEFTRNALQDMGWRVNPFPLIWHKSDNTGIIPDPARGPRRIYETCFHASIGDRKIVRPVSNVVSAPVTKTIHMSEKNYDMLNKFMSMFVDEHTVGIDPTCGSGNAVRAMRDNGATQYMGLEINAEFAALAKEQFNK